MKLYKDKQHGSTNANNSLIIQIKHGNKKITVQ